eukprot:TRINITY_DN18554_c0_g1_i1.p1 TRINITY_DN18554_c0_g1~~TRINITY_DN18554_c0_g1_i1.p1  ORF type:complete len:563 (+),score=130.53 TRINITY_DN18554_c0_g1_i1:62-1690(+)
MGCFKTNYHEASGCMLSCRSLGMVRPSISLTFCLLCSFGGALTLLVGLVGYSAAPEETHRAGTCRISRPGGCGCAEWDTREGHQFCTAFEVSFPDTVFTPDAGNTVTNREEVCALTTGAGSVPSCLHNGLTVSGLAIEDYTQSQGNFSVPCNVNEDTFQCFLPHLGLTGEHDKRTEDFKRMLIAGGAWLGFTVLWLCVLLYRDARKRGLRYQFLHQEVQIESEDETDVPAIRSGCHMPKERVAAKIDGEWTHGVVERRHGAADYDIAVGGRTFKVGRRDVFAAGFVEGGWIVVVREIKLPAVTLAPGLLGMVLSISDNKSKLSVSVGGHIFSPSPGQVAPTATLRRGVRLEVRGAADDEWREAALQGVQGAGIVLVTRPGSADVKAFKWSRRVAGIQEHVLPEEPEPADVPGTFVFVDPESKLAPTVMDHEEVKLYGGVRQVAKDLSEYRSAPMSKLVTSAALLSGLHLASQSVKRAEHVHELAAKESAPPELNPVAAQVQAAQPAPRVRRSQASPAMTRPTSGGRAGHGPPPPNDGVTAPF